MYHNDWIKIYQNKISGTIIFSKEFRSNMGGAVAVCIRCKKEDNILCILPSVYRNTEFMNLDEIKKYFLNSDETSKVKVNICDFYDLSKDKEIKYISIAKVIFIDEVIKRMIKEARVALKRYRKW